MRYSYFSLELKEYRNIFDLLDSLKSIEKRIKIIRDKCKKKEFLIVIENSYHLDFLDLIEPLKENKDLLYLRESSLFEIENDKNLENNFLN